MGKMGNGKNVKDIKGEKKSWDRKLSEGRDVITRKRKREKRKRKDEKEKYGKSRGGG